MRRSTRRERAQRLAARVKELSAEHRLSVTFILFGHALLIIAVQGSWIVLISRAVRRVVRAGEYRPRPLLRAAWSPTLGVWTGLVIAQRLADPVYVKELERWVSRRSPDDPQRHG